MKKKFVLLLTVLIEDLSRQCRFVAHVLVVLAVLQYLEFMVIEIAWPLSSGEMLVMAIALEVLAVLTRPYCKSH